MSAMIAQPSSRLSYMEWGTGTPTLVFLHYFSGAATSWQWVAQDLAADFRCIAIDLPGFGDSPPLVTPSLAAYSDLIQRQIAALTLDDFVLVGHSMGGKIALHVAANLQQPGLRQVMLIAPSPATQEPMPEAEQQRLLHHHPSVENAETTIDSATHLPLTDAQRETAIQTHVRAANSAWHWWIEQGMNHSIADQVTQITVPVTVFASPSDPVIPLEAIRQDVVELIPTANLVEIHDSGHLIPLEKPTAIAQHIRTQLVSSQG